MREAPLYIFDLDGTLALTEHRQHILDDKDNPHRWRDFFAACVDDQPNVPAIQTLLALRKSGAEVWVWSGRSDEVRSQTVEWLCTFGCLPQIAVSVPSWVFNVADRFRMRAAGDFTPDEQLKLAWLTGMKQEDRERLVAVFDDRDKVVEMWRANGVPCFQVARGAF